MNFEPTQEQQDIIDAFNTGDDLVIEAGAGTGKTTTLKMIAKQAEERQGLYIAFNKSTADEAKKTFPDNVQCSTAHSVAYRAVGYKYKDRLFNNARVPAWKAANILGITAGLELPDITFPPKIVARFVQDTVRNFCYSADEKISGRHLVYVRGCENYRPALEKVIIPLAKKAWKDLIKVDGELTFTHDIYLKLFQLSNPVLDYDFILLDESQDTNEILAHIIESQSCQKVLVGDTNQSLYQWRRAVDSMSKFDIDNRLYLTQSFRFGPAVAEEANKFLSILDSPMRIKGFDKIESTIVSNLLAPEVILCRTNAGVIEEAIQAQSKGQSVAIVGGTSEIKKFAEAARDLMEDKIPWHADFVAFKNWGDLVEYSKSQDGSDLRTLVRIIENYGVDSILQIVEKTVTEKRADILVSTAHKAKGLEWSSVKISSDFREPTEEEPYTETELMVAYVAVTRAINTLSRGSLSSVDKALEWSAVP